MKNFRNGLFLVMALITFSFYADNSTEVYAGEWGDLSGKTAKLNIEFRVYTDIADAVEQTAKGGYSTVSANTFVKVGDKWETEKNIYNKIKTLAESSLKKKTGKSYSVVSLVKATDRYANNHFAEDGTNTSVYDQSDSDVSIRFLTQYGYTPEDYGVIINVFASEAGPLNGWHVFGGAERYYSNSVFKTGLSTVGKTTYLFDQYGAKKYGWNVVQGWSMYFDGENGGLWTGKRKIGQTTYLFDSQGHKIDGWHRLNGKDYYFNEENGGMWTGKRTIGRTTYLLHNDGYKITGWYVDDYGDKYYFDPNFGGGMVTSLRKVGNAYYYFDTDTGSALTNDSMKIGGKNWYFNQSGIGSVVN